MSRLDGLQFREARQEDSARIAALHTDSWRHHYRGAYSDAFLDGDVAADRLEVWSDRLRQADPGSCTILVEQSSDVALIGFAHTIFDHDATWGALLDNLHVRRGHMRGGVGSRLLALTAEVVIRRSEPSGLYLWVLEQNAAAQAFYEACGGTRVDRALVLPPGGVPSRLDGSPAGLRYVWPEPAVLLKGR